ncbi:MAG: ribosome hibernation-promoting factor, HPF/YfiA family [Candidatus Saccharimonadales bacterium]
MIERIEISGLHMSVDDDLYKYVTKKIGKLDQYMSRHARLSVHANVKLKAAKVKTLKQATCEVILHLPKDTVMTKETTQNMFAAVDIVEQKLKNQLKKYKEVHERPYQLHRRVLTKIRRRQS